MHVIIIELTVPGFDQNCLWELNKSFLTLSTTTPLMQQLLVEEGVLSGIICELELFKNCSSSEVWLLWFNVCYLIISKNVCYHCYGMQCVCMCVRICKMKKFTILKLVHTQ